MLYIFYTLDIHSGQLIHSERERWKLESSIVSDILFDFLSFWLKIIRFNCFTILLLIEISVCSFWMKDEKDRRNTRCASKVNLNYLTKFFLARNKDRNERRIIIDYQLQNSHYRFWIANSNDISKMRNIMRLI